MGRREQDRVNVGARKERVVRWLNGRAIVRAQLSCASSAPDRGQAAARRVAGDALRVRPAHVAGPREADADGHLNALLSSAAMMAAATRLRGGSTAGRRRGGSKAEDSCHSVAG